MASTTSLPNSSVCWSKNGRVEQRIKPFATLDLHGKNREDAIRAVTQFWDAKSKSARNKNPWVSVITGTGSHSGALGGPVLKQAVHKLLIKRQMEFCYCKKPGGMFFVNVLSGHVLKHNPTAHELQAAGDTVDDAPWQDSKVKVLPRGPTAPLLPSQKTKTLGKKARKDRMNYAHLTTATGPQQERLNRGPAPTASELQEDQKLLDQAKSISLQDNRKTQSQRDKEEHAVRQAMQKTQQEALEEKRLEEEELQRILDLSQKEQHQPHQEEEEAELERILRISLEESARQEQSSFDEEEWQKVLSQSNEDHLQQQDQRQQQEDEELERVLRMSMAETQQQPKILVEDNEEDELQKVLRMSMVEASGIVGIHDTDLMEDAENFINSEENRRKLQSAIEEIESVQHQAPLPSKPSLQKEMQEDSSGVPSLEPFSYSGEPGMEQPYSSNTTAVSSSNQSFQEQKTTMFHNPAADSQMNPQKAPVPNFPQALESENQSAAPIIAHGSLSSRELEKSESCKNNMPAALPTQDMQIHTPQNAVAPSDSLQPLQAPLPVSSPCMNQPSLPLQTKQFLPPQIEVAPNHCLQPIHAPPHVSSPSINQPSTASPTLPPLKPSDEPSSTVNSPGEALLESILYKKPLLPAMQPWQNTQHETKKEPETNASIQFHLDSPTRSTNNNVPQPAILQPSSPTPLPQQPTTLPPAVLEHRLMEILQRPIVLPQPVGASRTSTGGSTSTTNSLSPMASSFLPSQPATTSLTPQPAPRGEGST